MSVNIIAGEESSLQARGELGYSEWNRCGDVDDHYLLEIFCNCSVTVSLKAIT